MKYLVYIACLCLLSFSSSAAEWIKRESLGGVARHRGTGISIAQKGYIGLGHVNGTGVNYAYDDWWEYDPASNSWTQKANYMGGVNYGALAWGTSNYGYVGGGVYHDFNYYRYDPSSNTWSAITDCPLDVSDRVALAVDNYGIVIDNSLAYKYDESTDTWIQISYPPSPPGIWNATFTLDGSAYMISGSTVLEYKASADTWLVKSSFPGLSTGGYAGFSASGHGYIACGYSGSLGNVNDEVWEYNPASDTWTPTTEFAGISRRFHVAFSIGEKGYLGCGTNGTNFKDFWEFNRTLDVDQQFIQSIKVYPNPTTNVLLIDTDEVISFYEIFNQNGQRIKQVDVTSSGKSIDVSDFPNGIYMIQITTENGQTKATKFIKQ